MLRPTTLAHTGVWRVRVAFTDPDGNRNLQKFFVSVSDPSPCNPEFTRPTPAPTGDIYTFDAVNNWIAYEVGSPDDLTIEWTGAYYGGCEF